MDISPRQHVIIVRAKKSGRVNVEELAAEFAVSVQTIRKDLNELCAKSLLVRTHGGATVSPSVENMSYAARRFMAVEAKQAIGKAAAALVPNSCSIFINIGTTTEAVASALSDHQHIMVITNNLNVAVQLYPRPNIETIVVGGVVRSSDGGVVGETALDMIRQFRVDFAIVGISAIDSDGHLFDFDYREVRAARAIIENARHAILVSDSSKFERTAPVRLGHISEIRTFITDRLDDEEFRAVCEKHDVRIVEALLPE